jgi:exonuclease VII large subunit
MEAGLPDIPTWRRRIDDLSRIAGSSVSSMSKQKRLEVDGVNQRLRGLDPRATLRRGFSVVELVSSGRALTGAAQASPGDELRITVTDGEVPAVVGQPGEVPPAMSASAETTAAPAKRKRNAKPPQPPASALLL